MGGDLEAGLGLLQRARGRLTATVLVTVGHCAHRAGRQWCAAEAGFNPPDPGQQGGRGPDTQGPTPGARLGNSGQELQIRTADGPRAVGLWTPPSAHPRRWVHNLLTHVDTWP